MDSTQPSLHETSAITMENTLTISADSKIRYLKMYNNFIQWRRKQRTDSFSETVFVAYFSELSKTKKSPTLWATYSMLRCIIQLKHNLDIKRYTNLSKLLKKHAVSYKSKKSRFFTLEQMQKFLKDAPDDKYLVSKVALIMGVNGACRSADLTNITIKNIEDFHNVMIVTLNNDNGTDRTFAIRDDLLKIVRKYYALRPEDCPTDRFFMHYRDGRCKKQPIGRNRVALYPKEIAKFLLLPDAESYTGHCFRKTSATLFHSGDILTLSGQGGCKSYEEILERGRCESHNVTLGAREGCKSEATVMGQSGCKLDNVAECNTVSVEDGYEIEIGQDIKLIGNDYKPSESYLQELLEAPNLGSSSSQLLEPRSPRPSSRQSSTSNESEELTLQDIQDIEETERATQFNMIPPKSKNQYMRAYDYFIQWKKQSNLSSFSENVFLEYFNELTETRKPSSLWTAYSMLRCTVLMKHNVDIKEYTNLTFWLKTQTSGYRTNMPAVFTEQNIQEFLNDAPDDYLVEKVALIFGLCGACSVNELVNITTKDIEYRNGVMHVILRDKTNRTFVVQNEYLHIVQKYESLRPADLQTNRFFINYKNSKCLNQAVGRNKIAKMPKEIAKYLNLPNPQHYSGYCYRRAARNANQKKLKRGRSGTKGGSYIKDSLGNRIKVTKIEDIAGRSQHSENELDIKFIPPMSQELKVKEFETSCAQPSSSFCNNMQTMEFIETNIKLEIHVQETGNDDM